MTCPFFENQSLRPVRSSSQGKRHFLQWRAALEEWVTPRRSSRGLGQRPMRSVCLTSETTDHKAHYQITRKDETIIAIVWVHSFTNETESGLVRTWWWCLAPLVVRKAPRLVCVYICAQLYVSFWHNAALTKDCGSFHYPLVSLLCPVSSLYIN